MATMANTAIRVCLGLGPSVLAWVCPAIVMAFSFPSQGNVPVVVAVCRSAGAHVPDYRDSRTPVCRPDPSPGEPPSPAEITAMYGDARGRYRSFNGCKAGRCFADPAHAPSLEPVMHLRIQFGRV